MYKKVELSPDQEAALKSIIDHFDEEDRSTREQQIIQWKRYKLMWEGINNIYWNAVAHDWRVWDQINENSASTDQAYYDKRVNVFRAYLESIIAALSVVVPPIKCYPDDATNNLDLLTAKTGDKVGELIFRHNDAPLLWLHGLFTYATEGMTAFYNYSHKDKKYGTYKVDITEDYIEEREQTLCPNCGFTIEDRELTPEEAAIPLPEPIQPDPMMDPSMMEPPPMDIGPDEQYLAGLENELGLGQPDPMAGIQDVMGQDVCPSCNQLIVPEVRRESIPNIRITGSREEVKHRVCQEVYGGLYVKVPNYARNQSECPYLRKEQEINVVEAVSKYERLKEAKKGKKYREFINNIKGQGGEVWDEYEQYGRLSPQYRGEYPENLVTEIQVWLRPCAFNYCDDEMAEELKKKFPDGALVYMINDTFCHACESDMDDCWTLLRNPLSDYVHFDPLGSSLTSIQEITVDLISLILQTIEHGIGQTFADPSVLNFKAYNATEVLPGGIFPATPKSGRGMNDAFHEIKTATLSQEVIPFSHQIQQMGQLVSGALPSLFGGQLEGSETASEYSMSKNQALQRLQNVWKMFTMTWKEFYGKSIDLFIEEMQTDERDVKRRKDGSFYNVLIRKADLVGRIGKVELEANENLPITWAQQKDTIMTLLTSNNALIQQFIMAPENLDLIKQSIGLTEFFVPGEDDRNKQYEEIQLLLESQPIPNPQMQDPMAVLQGQMMGQPMEEELPSVQIDYEIDNHTIQYEICRAWLISDVGRQTKQENPGGYQNVLLHAREHLLAIPPPEPTMAPDGKGAVPSEKPNEPSKKNAPITGENDVQTVA